MREYVRMPKPRGKSLALALGLTFALSIAGIPPVSAQEAAAESGDTGEKTQSAKQTQNDAPAKKTSGTSEVFVPTEEISEDYAVSFPVDI